MSGWFEDFLETLRELSLVVASIAVLIGGIFVACWLLAAIARVLS